MMQSTSVTGRQKQSLAVTLNDTIRKINTSNMESADVVARLEDLREQRRLSQREFAEKAGLREDSYSNWITRGTRIPASAIAAISKAHAVSADWLLTGREYSAPTTAVMTGAGHLKQVPPGSRAALLMETLLQLGKVQLSLQQELAEVMKQQEAESGGESQDPEETD